MEKKEDPEYVVFIRKYASGYTHGIVHSIKCSKYQRRRKNWNSQGEWGSEYNLWAEAKATALRMSTGPYNSTYSTCDKKDNPCC